MIAVAILFGALGVADIFRVRVTRPVAGTAAAMIAGALVIIAGAVLSGIAWWWILVLAALLAGWVLTTSTSGRTGTGAWPLLGLGIAIFVLAFGAGPQIQPDNLLADWRRHVAVPWDVEAFALICGGVLLLIETANIAVRIALPAPPTTTPPLAPAPSLFARLFGKRTEPAEPGTASAPPLKGGRLIGPLERVLILALALAGQFTAIGAIVAAKGIIRFPEISKDTADGSNAEYFLIGSFASWSVVLVVAILIGIA